MILAYHKLMKHLIYILLLLVPFLTLSQIEEAEKEQDSINYEYFIVEGDLIHKDAIDLDEIKLFNKLNFKDRQERVRYLILKRKKLDLHFVSVNSIVERSLR